MKSSAHIILKGTAFLAIGASIITLFGFINQQSNQESIRQQDLQRLSTQVFSSLDWFTTPKHIFFALPKEELVKGKLERPMWSPDGTKLLFTVSTPFVTGDISEESLGNLLFPGPQTSLPNENQRSLYVYDTFNQKLRKLKFDSEMVEPSGWYSDSIHFAVKTYQVYQIGSDGTRNLITHPESLQDTSAKVQFEASCLVVNSLNGNWNTVHSQLEVSNSSNDFNIETLPVGNEAILSTYEPPNDPNLAVTTIGAIAPSSTVNVVPHCSVIDAEGQKVRDLPSNPSNTGTEIYKLGADKVSLYQLQFSQKGPIYFYINSDGALDKLQVPPKLYNSIAPTPEMVEVERPRKSKLKKFESVNKEVWITSTYPSEKPDCLIDVTNGSGSLSPTYKAILISNNQTVSVRRILSLPIDFKARILEMVKTDAMNRAKQVGLGLLMYSGDSDDYLPLGNFENSLEPYLKNSNLLNGFNMTASPGTLLTSGTASTLQLGTVTVPGGTAIVFGDGHVTWSPSP